MARESRGVIPPTSMRAGTAGCGGFVGGGGTRARARRRERPEDRDDRWYSLMGIADASGDDEVYPNLSM
ncbi:hypothetical protein [Oryza sativa Japonica Group]|uniref:Uncharacterized protein n=2 Tax=Oryza sativa subsp. japonica TaxID=39947 RepID=Q5ZBE7_ORYSJ|nr:hypothetical protein [Oryza sativa Japonica Group]BAD53185.1 hypothetical protein [Oryza sativa Japonica Group]